MDSRDLVDLYAEANALTGQLPRNTDSLTKLETFHANSNRFTGGIPISWMKLVRLEEFTVADNLMTGTIPSEIFELTALQTLALVSTRLFHHLYDVLISRGLFLVHNISRQIIVSPGIFLLKVHQQLRKLGGHGLPISRFLNSVGIHSREQFLLPCLWRIVHLWSTYHTLNGFELTVLFITHNVVICPPSRLDISYNQFRGSLPDEIGRLTNLRRFRAQHNHLTGTLPMTMARMNPNLNLNLTDNL